MMHEKFTNDLDVSFAEQSDGNVRNHISYTGVEVGLHNTAFHFRFLFAHSSQSFLFFMDTRQVTLLPLLLVAFYVLTNTLSTCQT